MALIDVEGRECIMYEIFFVNFWVSVFVH